MDGELKAIDRATLIAARRQILHADDGWNNYTDDVAHDAFAKLESVQSALLKADFSGSDGLLTALEMLVEGDDHPNFTDEFKNCLFDLLRRVATQTKPTQWRQST